MPCLRKAGAVQMYRTPGQAGAVDDELWWLGLTTGLTCSSAALLCSVERKRCGGKREEF